MTKKSPNELLLNRIDDLFKTFKLIENQEGYSIEMMRIAIVFILY